MLNAMFGFISKKYGINTFLTTSFYLLLLAWWLIIFLSGQTDSPMNHIYGFIYGGFSIYGGLWGIKVAKEWGGFSSIVGKALYMLSFGLLAQAFGQYSFWFYNYVLKVAVPYPGIPDIGYFGTIPFYIVAALFLAKASGVKVSLSSFRSKLQALFVPVIMLLIGYFLFLNEYPLSESTPLQIFLDYGYPLGQAVYISIAILTLSLSHGILGGIMKNRVLLILFAFFAQFLAEYIFIYFHDLYFPASFIDTFYLTSYFLMTVSILQMRTVLHKLK